MLYLKRKRKNNNNKKDTLVSVFVGGGFCFCFLFVVVVVVCFLLLLFLSPYVFEVNVYMVVSQILFSVIFETSKPSPITPTVLYNVMTCSLVEWNE